MRTTVEITDAQHRALSTVARSRGLRGFSQLVQEALDGYLRDLEAGEIDQLLGLEGVLDEQDERDVRTRVAEAGAAWRAS
jgi:metal-responsive CopG/Arc/MetJ family transcriptional regulator